MFQVQLSFVVNLLSVSPVGRPNFTSNFFVTIPVVPIVTGNVQSYSSCPTFDVSLNANFGIFNNFSASVSLHYCPLLSPHLSVCILSLGIPVVYVTMK